MSEKISVVIHTYNNEKIIRECLESVKNFDEIVVCDMHSTDKTTEIAKEYNCKIVTHKNIGWADPARNFAISQASHEWVLVLDSDEKITEDLKNYLYDFIKKPENHTAIRIPRLNFCWGKPLEVLYPDAIIRFFKKDAVFWPPTVHGTPQMSYGETKVIDKTQRELAILHNYTDSYTGYINTLNKYTSFEVEKMIGKGLKINFALAIYKSFFLILEKYFLKKGYKDGVRGAIISITAGFYKFAAYVKHWEYLDGLKK